MVEKIQTTKIDELLAERNYPETKKLLEEIGKNDFRQPPIVKVEEKLTSCGNRIRISNLVKEDAKSFIGKIITVGGWARTIKDQGKGAFTFVKLNDGSTIKEIQAVVSSDISGFEKLNKQGVGACIRIKGLVIASIGSEQSIEIQVSDNEAHSCEVVGECNPSEYILHKSRPTLETLRNIGHLRPRTKTISSVARIRNSLSFATHQYFQQRGFLYVHTPLITGSDCEGAGEMFQVTTVLPNPKENISKVPVTKEGLVDYKDDFFKKPTFLTVSGQLAVENYACALSDVYTFGPTFRAEVSHTSRHLAEFWMIEPEMCFADIYDDMEIAENYLKYCIKWVLENNRDDLDFFDEFIEKGLVERLKNVVENNFVKITYTECIELLKDAISKDKKLFIEKVEKSQEEKEKEKQEKKDRKEKKKEKKDGETANTTETTITTTTTDTTTTETANTTTEPKKEEKKVTPKIDFRDIYWGMDMSSIHERYLTEVIFKKPIIVYNYPKEIKSFYMRVNDDNKTVAAMDILVPKIGEIIGGSQREERHDVLLEKIKQKGLDPESYWWYLELRKYGTVPHCGFGLGFERLVMMTTGIENIRDVIPYPRYPDHAEF